MDRELAGAVLERWESGLPVSETTLFKAASALGVDPEIALVEARFYTYFDKYLIEKRAMSELERIVFSGCAGLNPFSMEKTASAYGIDPDDLVIEALRRRGFVPNLEKLADLGGPPTVEGPGPIDMGDPAQMQSMQQALGIMGAPPQQQAMLQQQPSVRPSPTAPSQIPASPGGNLQDLLTQQQATYGQGAMDNGGLPPSGMPQPPPDPPTPEERVQQVGPNLDPDTVSRYSEHLVRFEQGINMQVADPKQMVKFVKELQKVDGKRIDQGIKAMGQQLEQEQAAELGVSGVPTIDGQAPTTSVLGPKPGGQSGQGADAQGQQQQSPAQPPQGNPQAASPMPQQKPAGPPQQPKPQQPQPPKAMAAEKVAHAARALARAHFR
jgi:hypothetical protein